MRHATIVSVGAVLCVLSTALMAQVPDSPATEASIRQLLEVTQARKQLDAKLVRANEGVQDIIARAMAGKEFSPGQEAIVDDMRKDLTGIINSTFSWEKLEPVYISAYQQSFTEPEVAGALAFYQTPAGRAMIEKQPLVMQHVMDVMQGRIIDMQHRMEQAGKDAIEKMKTCCGNQQP